MIPKSNNEKMGVSHFSAKITRNVSICNHIMSTRNSSGDEIANVNFLCDDIVHALKMQ